MKKCQGLLFVITLLPSSLCASNTSPSSPSSKSVNAAPAAFPVCTQAFRKIYDGTLSVTDVQQQSWFTSYDLLYKEYNGVQTSDSNVLSLLSQLKKEAITPEAATTSFTALQQTLINQTNTLLSKQ